MFVIFCLICGVAVVWFFPQNTNADMEFDTMTERLGHKVRYATWQVSYEAVDLLILADTENALDHTVDVSQDLEVAITQLDTLVLFLDGWEDINNLPWAARLELSHEGYLNSDKIANIAHEGRAIINQRTLKINGYTGHFMVLSINTQLMDMVDDKCLGQFLNDIISKPYWEPYRSDPTNLNKYYDCSV